MPFPIQTNFVDADDGPALLRQLEADAVAGGGTVVAHTAPDRWAKQLLDDGALDRGEVIGLAAALIQQGSAAAVCVGARLATYLDEPELGTLLLRALEGLDVGLLLTVDPINATASTEDTLLRCAHAVVNTALSEERHQLLAHLRRAGLADIELAILAADGAPTEIQLWLPAILEDVEGLASLEPLKQILTRGPDHAQAMAKAIAQLPQSIRSVCTSDFDLPEIIPDNGVG